MQSFYSMHWLAIGNEPVWCHMCHYQGQVVGQPV